MWTERRCRHTDVTVWNGPVDLKLATIRVFLLLSLGLLWFGIGAGIYSSL